MNTYLMCKDKLVLEFNYDEGLYDIKDSGLLPFQLKNRLLEVPNLENLTGNVDIQKTLNLIVKARTHNQEEINKYLARRVLSLSRENAKKLYSLFGFEQLQDDYSKAKIATACRSVSLSDNYWIKSSNDPVTWKDVSLRSNSLSETVAIVALHGSSLSLQGKVHTPELLTQGAYAKAWIREKDGLFLHKLGTKANDDIEARIEVMVSNILDKTNVTHVQYFACDENGRFASKCRCMTTDTVSILTGTDFISYCNIAGKNPDDEMIKIDKENIYKTWITDYLISNSDRHGGNWGFYYDSNSTDILKCHPLYDHNNAFDEELMKNKDADYIFFGGQRSMKETAMYAVKRVDYKFNEKILPSDFIKPEYYESFMDRACDLGLDVEQKEQLFISDSLQNVLRPKGR